MLKSPLLLSTQLELSGFAIVCLPLRFRDSDEIIEGHFPELFGLRKGEGDLVEVVKSLLNVNPEQRLTAAGLCKARAIALAGGVADFSLAAGSTAPHPPASASTVGSHAPLNYHKLLPLILKDASSLKPDDVHRKLFGSEPGASTPLAQKFATALAELEALHACVPMLQNAIDDEACVEEMVDATMQYAPEPAADGATLRQKLEFLFEKGIIARVPL